MGAEVDRIADVSLPNGLRVVVAPDRTRRVVGVVIRYGAGSLDDPDGRRGLVHLLEHLAWRGGPGCRRRALMDSLEGARRLGETHLSATHFGAAVPPDEVPTVLAVEADRMRWPLDGVSSDQLRAEIGVVRAESGVREGTPFGTAGPALLRALLPGEMDPAVGPDQLDGIGLEEAGAFARQVYRTRDTVVAILGPVDPETVLDLCGSAFAAAASADRGNPRAPAAAPRVGEATLAMPTKGNPAAVVGFVGPPPYGRGFGPFAALAALLGGVPAPLGSHADNNNGGRIARLAEDDPGCDAWVIFYTTALGSVLALRAMCAPGVRCEAIAGRLLALIDDAARAPAPEAEMARVRSLGPLSVLEATEGALEGAQALAEVTALGGSPDALGGCLRDLSTASASEVSLAAADLMHGRRAVLLFDPNAGGT